jgi:hypothetical protein
MLNTKPATIRGVLIISDETLWVITLQHDYWNREVYVLTGRTR